jgi:hypothetical protein
VEEAEGGGEVLGIVQEDLAVAWSGGLEHHCCGAGGEGVGERGLDEFGDVVAVGVLVDDCPGSLSTVGSLRATLPGPTHGFLVRRC